MMVSLNPKEVKCTFQMMMALVMLLYECCKTYGHFLLFLTGDSVLWGHRSYPRAGGRGWHCMPRRQPASFLYIPDGTCGDQGKYSGDNTQ